MFYFYFWGTFIGQTRVFTFSSIDLYGVIRLHFVISQSHPLQRGCQVYLFTHCTLQCKVGKMASVKEDSNLQSSKKTKKTKYESTVAADKRRGKTRVNIGAAFSRWSVVKESEGLKSHADVATFLLDR